MSTAVEHLVYAPVPYKGYAVRAKSEGANVESFKNAFKDWLIPFDQSVILRGFLNRVIVLGNRRLYFARVFQAQGLDELKRSGAVSHIAEIPIDLLLQKKLLVSSVDRSMAEFTEKNGISTGDIVPLEVAMGFEKDVEFNMIREMIPESVFGKMVELTGAERFKLFIIYRNYDVDILAYGLARIFSKITSKWTIIASEGVKRDVLFLYDGVLIIGKTLPPWARIKGWSIINLDKERGSINLGAESVGAIIKEIYHEKETDQTRILETDNKFPENPPS